MIHCFEIITYYINWIFRFYICFFYSFIKDKLLKIVLNVTILLLKEKLEREGAEVFLTRTAETSAFGKSYTQWLKDDLRRQDFGQTLFIINRMKKDDQDLGLLNFYQAEALKLQGKNLDAAAGSYIEASKYPDAPLETQRQLGDVYRKLEKNSLAIEAYKKYLNLNPNAEDNWIIEDLISTLSKNNNQAQNKAS